MIEKILRIDIIKEIDGEIAGLLTENKIYSEETRLKIVKAAGEFEAAVKKAVGREERNAG